MKRFIYCSKSPGQFWFRFTFGPVKGYGLCVQDHRVIEPYFSERRGYKKYLHVGPFCFEALKPSMKRNKWPPPSLQRICDQDEIRLKNGSVVKVDRTTDKSKIRGGGWHSHDGETWVRIGFDNWEVPK